MHADRFWLNELLGRVTGCALNLRNTLGAGFLEKVYENALAHELHKVELDRGWTSCSNAGPRSRMMESWSVSILST
jgi:hypothetical protein